MAKTKTIDPYLIATISAFSCIIPISTFLLFRKNWKEKLKWICFLLIVVNFSFDQISVHLSKKPIASGLIYDYNFDSTKIQINALLGVNDGEIHEGILLRSRSFTGIITTVHSISDTSGKQWVGIQGNITSEPTTVLKFQAFSTLKVANISLIIELTLIFLIFYHYFKKLKPWNYLVMVALCFSIFFWVYRHIILDKLHSYGGFYTGATTILIILFALVFFYTQLTKLNNSFVYSASIFWIISAILIYRAGTFFLFLYANTLDQEEKTNFFTIHSAFYIVQNLLFAVAFTVKNKLKSTLYQKRIAA